MALVAQVEFGIPIEAANVHQTLGRCGLRIIAVFTFHLIHHLFLGLVDHHHAVSNALGVGCNPRHDVRADNTSGDIILAVYGTVLFIMVLTTLAKDIHYKGGWCDLHWVGMRVCRRSQALVTIPGLLLEPFQHRA